MDTKQRKRNYCLDFIKGIACICVVFMHCEFPGEIGVLIQCVSRFCVPLFFMVSGYFCYHNRGGTNYLDKIKHIAVIILGATLFYLIVTPIYKSDGFTLSVKDLVKLAMFNVPIYIAGQLWFLFALFCDYILFALTEKLKLRKTAYFAIPIGIALYIFSAQGLHLLGHSIPNYYYRNFLIEGFPLFTLGFWIHENQERIHVSNKILCIIVLISTLLCPIERLLLGRDFGINIVTFPQVIALFLLGINNPSFGEGKILNKLGAVYSMYVYIIHPAVWHLLDKLYVSLSIQENPPALYARPIFCVALTVIISVLFVNAKNYVMRKVIKKA